MRKPDPTEVALSALRTLRETGDYRSLPDFLRHRSSAVVARAAKLAADPALIPELVNAFRRIMRDPLKLDSGCSALTNIVTALVQMEAPVAEIYSVGIRHHQWEPIWGGQVDTGASLRGICAMGLVGTGDPEALLACTDLLNDHLAEARCGAARALGFSNRPDAELVLRYKAAAGDETTDVTAECFTSILRLGPRTRSVSYVAGFLQAKNEETREAAALALGESRFAGAVPLLIKAFPGPGILLGLALSRMDEATLFVLDQLETGTPKNALSALQALVSRKAEEALPPKIREILNARQDPQLEKIWAKDF